VAPTPALTTLYDRAIGCSKSRMLPPVAIQAALGLPQINVVAHLEKLSFAHWAYSVPTIARTVMRSAQRESSSCWVTHQDKPPDWKASDAAWMIAPERS